MIDMGKIVYDSSTSCLNAVRHSSSVKRSINRFFALRRNVTDFEIVTFLRNVAAWIHSSFYRTFIKRHTAFELSLNPKSL